MAKLYKELGVIDMETLKAACEENKVQALAGFGKKTEEKILEAIDQVGSSRAFTNCDGIAYCRGNRGEIVEYC